MNQLPLFTSSPAVRMAHQHAAQKPHRLRRQRGEPYNPTNTQIVQQVIIDTCRTADTAWTPARKLYRTLGMHPSEVAAIARGMARKGQIEITELHYKNRTPGTPGYCGYQQGYRLQQQVEA